MKIGLIDVDGHNFPNLALMKLSSWHKAQGDSVEWYEPMFSGHMDRVYMSKVFTFTPDYEYCIDADTIVKGGTGYKMYGNVLPDDVENTFPDYSIYPQYDYAIGFLTRGCIRKCPWCIVPRKEGQIHAVNTWQNIKRPDSKKILFMDNNVLACEHGRLQMKEMAGRTDIRIDFNQGLDHRLVDDEMAETLAAIPWIRFLRLACDTEHDVPAVIQTVKLLGGKGLKPHRIFVYALIKDVDEAHARILALNSFGVEVFAQPYRDFDSDYVDPMAKKLARWVNNKYIFRSCTWENYLKGVIK